MTLRETSHIIIALVFLFIVISFQKFLLEDYSMLPTLALFACIIIGINVLSKKIIASKLDAGVEHSIWTMSRFGFKRIWSTKKKIPTGILIPIVISALSLGIIKIMTLLTYETTALKRRAARRFGFYSFTEMTDFHIAVIGAAGISATLLLSLVCYFIPGLEQLARLSAYYAFFNMIPFSKLDGAQIFYGSRPIYYVLGIITVIFATYALFLI